MAARGDVVVLGGGVAGLAAGYYLARDGWPVTVVERSAALGGLCGSFASHGFTLDHGPHKLYSVVPGILDEIRSILGDALIEQGKITEGVAVLQRLVDLYTAWDKPAEVAKWQQLLDEHQAAQPPSPK